MVSHLTGRAAAWATVDLRLLELRLKQGNKRVVDYAIQFHTLAADSGWDAPAIKDSFINGLNENVKDQLAPHEPPEEFEDLVDMAVRIDIRLQERESEQRRSGRRSSEPPGRPEASGSFTDPAMHSLQDRKRCRLPVGTNRCSWDAPSWPRRSNSTT
ncbi:hypothetical protein L3Q82_008411 [Scortum barcoo]|uniref:Uncharacterized protein n=1 Tax=Scortum barcoo TaxID=214431 RepID=A0ACB8XBF5_9TELE|nr:hypothetical protein L3Q82_008411 [Scortum barcoo]